MGTLSMNRINSITSGLQAPDAVIKAGSELRGPGTTPAVGGAPSAKSGLSGMKPG